MARASRQTARRSDDNMTLPISFLDLGASLTRLAAPIYVFHYRDMDPDSRRLVYVRAVSKPGGVGVISAFDRRRLLIADQRATVTLNIEWEYGMLRTVRGIWRQRTVTANRVVATFAAATRFPRPIPETALPGAR